MTTPIQNAPTTQAKNKYVPRVNQIDAIYLNKDITRIIRENLLENIQAITPALYTKIQPELDLLIHSVIWIGSVGKRCSTFGQQLLVLSYDSERLTNNKLCLHFALTVLPGYIKGLYERRLSNRFEWLHQLIQHCEHITIVFTIINFFRFLKTGRRPTIIDFLLGLDYVSLKNNQRRDIGYKYLTRELLWGGFMELLGLVLPIINFRKIQRLVKTTFLQATRGCSHDSDSNIPRAGDLKIAKLDLNTTCVFCGERPTRPHHMGCGHVYCYYCLSANVLTDSSFGCIQCGAPCHSGIHAL